MNVSAIEDLRYCDITVKGKNDAMMVDLLLTRIFGERRFSVRKDSEKRQYSFKFWATSEEFGAMRNALDNARSEYWDSEYEDLISSKEL